MSPSLGVLVSWPYPPSPQVRRKLPDRALPVRGRPHAPKQKFTNAAHQNVSSPSFGKTFDIVKNPTISGLARPPGGHSARYGQASSFLSLSDSKYVATFIGVSL